MGRRASQQSTFGKGELDPDLSERIDLEHYYDSLGVAENCVFHPQGGFSDRGGFELCSDPAVLASGAVRRLRRRIVPVPISAGNVTAINGGTAAYLVDELSTTVFISNAVTAADFVVVEIDFLTPQRVDFVDLNQFNSELAGADEAIAVQYWSGTSWETFADAVGVPAAKHIRTNPARTRRFGTTPGGPGGVPVIARQWRVVALGAVGIGRVSIRGLRMWRETDGLTPMRVRELAREDTAACDLVISERNIDVFRDLRYIASIPTEIAAQQVPLLCSAGGFDTMVLFHEQLPTPRIERQGSDGEWDISRAPFVNVPSLDPRSVLSATTSTSTSSNTIAASGSVTFVIQPTTNQYNLGSRIRATVDGTAGGYWIEGVVTATSNATLSSTGSVTFTVDASSGSGTYSSWSLANVTLQRASVVFSGNQDEIQDLDLTGLMAGQSFVLFLGDLKAGVVTVSTPASLPGQVRAALATLPTLYTATADIICDSLAADMVVRIRFGGANGNRSWPLVSAIPVDAGDVQPMTTVVQSGFYSLGPYWGDSTGWPRTGMFVQQRLMLAGFRSAPTSFWFSLNPTFWDFSHGGDPLTADRAFGGALDVDDVEIIHDVCVGRHLQIFTKTSEFWSDSNVLSATQLVRFTRATGQGMQRGVPLMFVDGATLFVQKGATTLREFQYIAGVQPNYSAEPLSVICPHLLKTIVDCGNRPARSVRDGNLLLLVNDDGSMACITTLAKQQVIAGAPWVTDGRFLSIKCGIDFDVTAAIERGGDRWLERWSPSMPLDHATRLALTSPSAVIADAGHVEGRSDIWAYADGELYGPLAVSGGVLTLPVAASDVVYGLAPSWSARSQVVREKLQSAQPFRSPGRIYEIELHVAATGAIAVGTNGGEHVAVPLTRSGERMHEAGPLEAGGDPMQPMLQRLFTGSVLVDGLLGFSRHPYFELSRPVPAPVHVKAVRYELTDRGD